MYLWYIQYFYCLSVYLCAVLEATEALALIKVSLSCERHALGLISRFHVMSQYLCTLYKCSIV